MPQLKYRLVVEYGLSSIGQMRQIVFFLLLNNVQLSLGFRVRVKVKVPTSVHAAILPFVRAAVRGVILQFMLFVTPQVRATYSQG